MDSQNSGGWPHSSGPNQQSAPDSHAQMQQRSHGSYGTNHPLQQGSSMQLPGPVSLPPPQTGSFFNNQANGNSLPALAGLTQVSPQQAGHQHQRQSPPMQHHHIQSINAPQPQQSHGFPLPALGQSIQQNNNERERHYQDAELRELEERQQRQQHEREMREQQRISEQQRSPPDNRSGSLPLQQPVASRVPAGLHGPNGILSSNPNVGTAAPLGAPSGPANVFANGAQSHEPAGRPYMPQPQGTHLNPVGPPQQAPNGPSNLPQGQQPILNDALTYLDQVKVQFQDQPDVYNRFLDIMKDFKSQAIDTPGVIQRVSSLFNGHPRLIQGFNTFLPPGYRIEAGYDDNPHSIRVTTPSGTINMESMQIAVNGAGVGDGPTAAHGHSPRQLIVENSYRAHDPTWSTQNQQSGGMEGHFSPESRSALNYHAHQSVPRPAFGPQYAGRDEELPANEAAAIAHHQEQRGVSQLQSAVNVASDPSSSRLGAIQGAQSDGVPNTLGQAVGLNGPAASPLPTGAQLNLEKRGPVEFNHAITYVNKIKNRFATQPEIYKQFLEILQTYQRESKPIQDVYAQVTQLFNAAPDLLEDFKQFLPESAAQAKAQAAAARQAEESALSNVRGDPSYISGIGGMQAHTPKPEKMPPIGNFSHPSSVSKENKKRRGGPGAQVTIGASASTTQDTTAARHSLATGSQSKRPKTTAPPRPPMAEIPVQHPSLVPDLPYPMPPTSPSNTSSEAMAFFDRVRKFIGNKQAYNEFLKLCNLYSQDVIDKNTLIQKAEGFIGANPDLIGFFRRFVLYPGQDEQIDNRPAQSDTKVVLSNCRGLGPSYRLLPKRERFAKCSGRDETCHEVLNDEWASHPTWASEDSGFVSHRKNQNEEALYRMEEERHDYDFNIETALRTIQLLEPIVQQLKAMSLEEQRKYQLPPGLGGQSEAIWQRVIKKLYDRPMGCKVVEDMFLRPARICPVLLFRLKEKVEKWKQAQREWEKVWREQTQKVFWKSLDSQSVIAKAENKRAFQPKALQTDIQAKHEEQKRQRQIKPSEAVPRYQLDFPYTDAETIMEASHLLLTYLRHSYNAADQSKIENFLKTFLPTFFGIDKDAFVAAMADVYADTPPNEEEDEALPNEDAATHRGRKGPIPKKDLRRGLLDPKASKKDRDSRAGSKESTPDVLSMDEDSSTPTDTQSERPGRFEPSESRWMEHPTNARQGAKYNEPFTRNYFSLYANQNIYCFMRMFGIVYERLSNLKSHEIHVRDDVHRSLSHKPANELRISDKNPTEFFDDTTPGANYYRQLLRLFEGSLERTVETSRTEDILRRFYIPCGWQMYNFDKTLQAVIKYASQMVVNDNKERNSDIITLFMSNRSQSQTTHVREIVYRKQVEKLVKDGDVYRIVYNQGTQHVAYQIFKKDDQTFETSSTSDDFNWSYYVTAFVMRDWTEGVPHTIHWPFLRRNIPNLESEDDFGKAFLPFFNEDGLCVRIAPETYRLMWEKFTTDWWVHERKVRSRGMKGMVNLMEQRKSKFEEKFIENARWMAGLSLDSVNKKKAEFHQLVHGEAPATKQAEEGESNKDTTMGGT